MKVAKLAATAAVGLAVLGALVGMGNGDFILASSAVPCLFVAALFWSLAEIGEKLGPSPSHAGQADVSTAPVLEAVVPQLQEPTGADLKALERKLAAKRT
ncbi:hypothetical protein [Tabrizicola sp.]|uniref:hypothetical protein n=1 Tax=Tabrizicola sp. TaxID=2005166 RepID=UPI0025CEBB7F|nr:hypothetical protein [Tabrizicola sp.]